jgi:hypothetical protein
MSVRGMTRDRSLLRGLALVLGMAVLVVAQPARAERLAGPLEAAIHLRALGYDRALKDRAGDTALIAILYDPGSDASVSAADDISAALVALSKKMKLQGLPIAVKSIAYKDSWPSGELSKAAAVYVAPGLESHLADIRTQAARQDVPTLCGDRELAKSGLSIAVYRKGSSPGLTINLVAARAAGMDLDSRLLSIAEVIK